ncbi:MAG: hypothetical protein ACOY4U_00070, partial [Pseudomonadota bacterium]
MDKPSTMLERIKMNKAGLVVLALIAAALLLYGWSRQPAPAPVNVSVPAAPAPEVKREKKIVTPIKTRVIRTYAPPAKRDLRLPEVVQADAAKQVLESSQVPA